MGTRKIREETRRSYKVKVTRTEGKRAGGCGDGNTGKTGNVAPEDIAAALPGRP